MFQNIPSLLTTASRCRQPNFVYTEFNWLYLYLIFDETAVEQSSPICIRMSREQTLNGGTRGKFNF